MTWCQGVWQGVVSVRVDYTVTNLDVDKSIKLPDPRFTVICLDRLNKLRTHTNIFAVPAEIRTWRLFKHEALTLAPYSSISTIENQILSLWGTATSSFAVLRDPVTGARLLGQVLERHWRP